MTLSADHLPFECRTRREAIAATVDDLVVELLYYGRKEDKELPLGEIEEAVACGEVTVEEIVDLFGRVLKESL